MTLVDTNVLLDVFTNDANWATWSAIQLDQAAANGRLLINDVVYAELVPAFSTKEKLDGALLGIGVSVEGATRDALFLAGRAFQRYRAAGGTKTGVLADFFIGAHAAVAGSPLLTRDPRRYRTYFPAIVLITP